MAQVHNPDSAYQVEKQQESLLKAKYGGLKPKQRLIQKEHKFFDSADWALAKEGKKQPLEQDPASLPPVTGPIATTIKKQSSSALRPGL
eukprot:jgi/Chrzof1/9082/Cz03g35130.t1